MITKRVLYILLSFTILLTMNLPTFADTSDGGAISAITLNTPANLTQYYNAMERVDFTATPTPATGADLSAISWYVNDVSQGITGTAFVYTPTYVGTYEVSAKVTDTPSIMASKTITVSAATAENTLLALSYTPVGGSESVNLLGSTYPAFTYRVALAASDTAVPTINYFKKDPDSQVVVQNAAAIPGITTVVVSGAAGTTPKTYTILWDNSGDFQYITSGSTSTVTGYTGSSGTVTIPDVIGGKFVKAVGGTAQFCGNGVETIVFSNTVESINSNAFSGCTGLKKAVLSPTVKTLGQDVFEGCSALTALVLPNSVTDMGTVGRNNGLVNIEVDENNTAYADDDGVLFNKNKTTLICYPMGKSQTGYTIPAGVISIAKAAFSGAGHLLTLLLPASLQTIGDGAFLGCGVTAISLPASVTGIGTSLVLWDDLTAIAVDGSNTTYADADGVLFNKAKTSLIRYPAGKSGGSYTLPDGVATIENNAFSECDQLTSVNIPDTVTTIAGNAFSGMDKTKLTLYCDAGSAAEAYAIANSYLYQATPATPAALTKTYTAGLKLSDVALPAGYAWTQPDTLLTVPGGSYPAVYTPTDAGQSPVTMDLAVTVSKANPAVTFPTISAVTYTKNLKLSDIALPTGFAWELPAKTLSAPGGSYKVTYTPTDTANYNTITQNVTVTVNNASQNTPKLKVMSRTEDTIIIQAVSGAEYAIKLRSSSADPIYGSSNKFTSLNDDTQYTVYIRMAGKLNYDPSPAESATVRTEESTGVRRPTVKIVGGDSWPKDIGEVAWAQGYIEDVLKRGIMVGSANPDGTVSFKPGDTATRAEFATALYKYMGKKEYAYVPYDDTKDHWAIEYISRLTKDGIMTGTGGNLFEPDEAITREQIATILNRAFKPGGFVSDYRYVDHSAISDWAVESVYQVYGAGWMSGDETGTFRPDDTATRAEIAAIFSRLATANVR